VRGSTRATPPDAGADSWVGDIAALLSTIDAGASGLTICRLTAEAKLVGTAFDGVTALQVLTGTLRLTLPDDGRCVARAGELVLVPAGVRPILQVDGAEPHRVVEGGASLQKRDGWLVADATRGRPATLVVAAARITGTAERSLGRVLLARIADRAEGRGAIAMLRAEVARAEPGATTLAVTLMSLCIVVGLRVGLAAAEREGGVDASDRRPALERAIAAVRARPADPHSIDTLAAAAGMSRSTLLRHFRTVLRTTPAAFILRARLIEAASLLRNGRLAIKEVAALTGFADRSHFSRAFSRQFGAEPSRYRAQAIETPALGGGPEAEQVNDVPDRVNLPLSD
jgi:AraC family transcriptional regulator, activator of mtrCDE